MHAPNWGNQGQARFGARITGTLSPPGSAAPQVRTPTAWIGALSGDRLVNQDDALIHCRLAARPPSRIRTGTFARSEPAVLKSRRPAQMLFWGAGGTLAVCGDKLLADPA